MAQASTAETPRSWAPDAVTIILFLCLLIAVASAVAEAFGVTAARPGSGEIVAARSLFSAENVRRLLTEMPQTFAHFHPLGMVVVVMLGAGLADKVGLFDAALGKMLKRVPGWALLPGTVLIGICSHVAVDASYFVFIPLAGYAFKAAGRDPFVGILAAFAGVSGGYGANLLVTPTDAAIYGLTEAAAQTIDPSIEIDLVANYYIMAAFALVVTAVVTLVTVLFVQPRYGARPNPADAPEEGARPTSRPGALAAAGLAMAGVLAAAAVMSAPGGPLRGEDGGLQPLYDSLVAIVFLMFLLGGLAFGICDGRIRSDADVLKLLRESITDIAPFFMLAFAAAHFGAFLNWSNLALIGAAEGAAALQRIGLEGAPLVVVFVMATAGLNLLMASASGKWAILAPAVVPMLMSVGLSPELITAAYRIADSATNIVTPVSLLPVVLIFAQRYRPDIGLLGFIRLMIPYSACLLLAGIGLLLAWMALDLPLGPSGAQLWYILPEAQP